MDMTFWLPEAGAALPGGGALMDFYAVLDQVLVLLRQRRRMSYRHPPRICLKPSADS